jgi:hypothetical protein
MAISVPYASPLEAARRANRLRSRPIAETKR